MRARVGEIEDFLNSVPLFFGLSPAELQALAVHVRPRSYPEGEVIFHKDDPGTGLYVVRSGTVKISIVAPEGQETLIALMSAGDCFGELAVLDGEPRSATASALERTDALYLPRDDFLRFLNQRPQVMMKIIVMLSRRLRMTDEQLSDLVFFDVYGRLAKKLLELANTHGRPTTSGPQITLPLTQQELANLVGSSRESVNKAMRYYREKGFVSSVGHRITILRPDLLQQRALL